MRDPYEVLGVERDISLDDLKTIYRNLAKEFHPDKNDNSEYYNDRFSEINISYRIILDERKEKDSNIPKSDNGAHSESNSFYKFDRKQTFKKAPLFNFNNSKNPTDEIFFEFPNNIGEILFGASDLKKNEKPIGKKELIIESLTQSALWIAGIIAIALIAYVSNKDDPNQGLRSIVVTFLITSAIVAWRYYSSIIKLEFLRMNNYICEQGFAIYIMSKSPNNLIYSKELSFIDIEQLFLIEVPVYAGFIYSKTDFMFAAYGLNSEDVLHKAVDEYKASNRRPSYPDNELIYFYRSIAEQYGRFKFDSCVYNLNQGKSIEFFGYYYGKMLKAVELNKHEISFYDTNGYIQIPFNLLERITVKRNRIVFIKDPRKANLSVSNKKASLDTVYLGNKHLLYLLLSHLKTPEQIMSYDQ